MKHTVLSKQMTIAVKEKGAELCSLKFRGEEFLWQAHPDYWAKSSPVLFPFVGGLKNNSYIYKNTTYQGIKHGFARDLDFKLLDRTSNQISFGLQSDETTYQIYPFYFEFYITYNILDDGIEIHYRVVNKGSDTMYFSLGAHPAFDTPVTNDISLEDYYLEFEKEENAQTLQLDGLLIGNHKKECLKGKILPLHKDIFQADALIFENLKSNVVSLKCKKTTRTITADFSGFPYLAFWNVPGAAFVCIEPWYGIADFVNTSGKLEEKTGMQSLVPNGKFDAVMKIRLEKTKKL